MGVACERTTTYLFMRSRRVELIVTTLYKRSNGVCAPARATLRDMLNRPSVPLQAFSSTKRTSESLSASLLESLIADKPNQTASTMRGMIWHQSWECNNAAQAHAANILPWLFGTACRQFSTKLSKVFERNAMLQ